MIKVFLDKVKGRDNLKSYYDAETKLSESTKSEEYKKLAEEMNKGKSGDKVDSAPTPEAHKIDISVEAHRFDVLSRDLAKDYVSRFL